MWFLHQDWLGPQEVLPEASQYYQIVIFFPLSSPSRIFMRGFIDAPEEIPVQTSFDKE